MEDYIKALEERARSYEAEAEWESNGRASFCKGKALAIRDIIKELKILTAGD